MKNHLLETLREWDKWLKLCCPTPESHEYHLRDFHQYDLPPYSGQDSHLLYEPEGYLCSICDLNHLEERCSFKAKDSP